MAEPVRRSAALSALVLGLGSFVHSEGGVGDYAIHRLQRDPRVPASVTLIDGRNARLTNVARKV
jgi:hypothetical protein